MATFKLNRAGLRKLEQDLNRKIEQANRRAQARSSTPDEYKMALAKELRRIGVEPNEALIAKLVDQNMRRG